MKTVLLAVCGLTPQVITETLYALHQQGQEVDAIRILTTREGKAACIAQLFGAGDGHYHRYLHDYQVPVECIDFGQRQVTAVCDAEGREIDDISDETDNEAFLRACMETTFDLTSAADTRVIFSIAGGRKTMGACLSLAAQCYARPQDRIYHVLVSPEFESSREFYYPPTTSRPITLYDRQRQPYQKETRYARVTLVAMPFVPLRSQLTPQMLRQPETPRSLLLSLVREERPELTIDLAQRRIRLKGVEIDLMPARLALYAFFAQHKKNVACTRPSCRNCHDCYLSAVEVLEHQERISALYETITTRYSDAGGITALDSEYFNAYKSKINREIAAGFGDYEAQRLQIEAVGKKPGLRYGIPFERSRIRLVT